VTIEELQSNAEITYYQFSDSEEGYHRGDKIHLRVKIKNTGETTRSFWVGATYVQPGYSFDDWPDGCYDVTPKQSDVISPGETDFVHLYFDIPDGAPIGKYDARIAVWNEYDQGKNKLEGKFNQMDLLNIFEVHDLTIHKKALIIGCWDYSKTSSEDLPGAQNSMYNIKELISSGFGFSVKLLRQPNKERINESIAQMKEHTDKNDIKFIYYTGHGGKWVIPGIKGEYLFLPSNQRYYDYALDEYLTEIENLAGVFDCCYSGGLCKSTDDDVDRYPSKAIESKEGIEGNKKVILMSANSTQFSFVKKPGLLEEGYNVFTHYLIEAFTTERDKARNLISGDSSRVSLEEAFKYAKQKVEENNPYPMGLFGEGVYVHPQIYDAWPTKSDNHEQFYLSDNPINDYSGWESHSPVHLHAYDELGRHVGLNEQGGIDREIPSVYYSGPWVENETIIVFNPENHSNIRIVGEAYDDGNFTLENKKYTKENQTIITTTYETIFVQNGSIVTVDVENSEFGNMKVDENGDGNIDKEIQTHVLPVANFIYSAKDSKTNQTITFDASSSYDPDGHIISFYWSFGDGNTENGETVTHTYKKSGNYTVTLMATDNESYTNTYSVTIHTKVKGGGGIPGFEMVTLLAAVGAILWLKRRK